MSDIVYHSLDEKYRVPYAPINPYSVEYMQVDSIHSVYIEQSGNPNGVPVIIVHGGPGAGTVPLQRQFFDPKRYRIILFDQRGSGNSRPLGCIVNNTTWNLVSDMELIRTYLGIECWVVFGGSWGSSLSLIYSITHPQRVRALILCGIFLANPCSIAALYDAPNLIFPDALQKYVAPIPCNERNDVLSAYNNRILHCAEPVARELARVSTNFSVEIGALFVPPVLDCNAVGNKKLATETIAAHYFSNGFFLPSSNWILDNIPRVRHIPTIIIQGRYDVICPMRGAWDLHLAFPEALLEIYPDSGHSQFERGLTDGLVRAADRFAQ